MKRILVSLLAGAIVLSAAACAAQPAPASSAAASVSASAEAVTANLPDTGDIEIPVDGMGEQEYAEYSGKFVSIDKTAGQLTAIDDKGEHFIFNFDDETIFSVDADTLKEGDPLYVRHSMAVTFSLPPQSYAFEFSAPVAPVRTDESGSAVTAQAADSERLYVADAALYRGVMQDVAVDPNGNTVWILEQVEGRDYGHPTLQIALTADTKYSFDTAAVGNGAYLEVFYAGEPDASGTVEAIAVNDAGPRELVIYNGIIKEVAAENDTQGSILLDPLAEGSMGYQFNYDESTQFMTDLAALKPGMKLHVYHSPASTRSIPPQSHAFEISLMAE